jgi:hypothetical protein
MTTETEQAEKLISPLPWRAELDESANGLWRIRDANDFVVLAYVTKDEAEFIVDATANCASLATALTQKDEELKEWKSIASTAALELDHALQQAEQKDETIQQLQAEVERLKAALYEIAAGKRVWEREEMIDHALETLCPTPLQEPTK